MSTSPSGLNLCRLCAGFLSLHSCGAPVVMCLEGTISLGHQSLLALKIFLPLLPLRSLNLEGRGLIKTSHLGLLQSLNSRRIVQLWVLVLVPIKVYFYLDVYVCAEMSVHIYTYTHM